MGSAPPHPACSARSRRICIFKSCILARCPVPHAVLLQHGWERLNLNRGAFLPIPRFGCPMYDRVGLCQARFFNLCAETPCGVRDGVKGAVLWRSSGPLTPSRPLPQSNLERRSEFFSELRSIPEKIGLSALTTQARVLNQSFSMDIRFHQPCIRVGLSP